MKKAGINAVIKAKVALDIATAEFERVAEEAKKEKPGIYESDLGVINIVERLGARRLDAKLLAQFVSEDIIEKCKITGANSIVLQVRPK